MPASDAMDLISLGVSGAVGFQASVVEGLGLPNGLLPEGKHGECYLSKTIAHRPSGRIGASNILHSSLSIISFVRLLHLKLLDGVYGDIEHETIMALYFLDQIKIPILYFCS
ncbi:hypothetical protein BP00DRAFT_29570 [Aspergillus indologenus CBS 114.80]|uniref:Uncharacterized protein n=1 Tax=Aspergillus indologenus CBS 114.80 TaxID=1450541 RepID=A0A2V5HSC3_9EURO|nr:hypothetical protein BP00DRAFT_29570 [Aspergillus indologenus CBS 114.80]